MWDTVGFEPTTIHSLHRALYHVATKAWLQNGLNFCNKQLTVIAPSEAAATIRKIFFQLKDAATNQERPLFKKYFFKLSVQESESN